MKSPLRRVLFRGLTLCVLAPLLAFVLRPFVYLGATKIKDVDRRAKLPAGFVDDASRLNPTKVAEVWPIPADREQAERQLAELLRHAARDRLPVAIAGAKHSMGGHTIAADGIVVEMTPFNHLELEEPNNRLTAGAGARWTEIVPFLDARGRSVAIMQSNSSFSVGGSISVNCHGWQHNQPPIASSVESLRLMKADGSIVCCSRDENAELFSLVLGGYGLFGVILDVELRVVPNERYRAERQMLPVDEYVAAFHSKTDDNPRVGMVYGRLRITPQRLLQDAVLTVFVRDPAADGSLPSLSEPSLEKLQRTIFRASAGSDYGKELRWEAETQLQQHLGGKHFSRNQLLHEGVEVFQNRTADTTDILHEYFLPEAQFVPFLESLRTILPRHKANLLNVTVRNLHADPDSFLRYADQPMFAFVMLFVQPRTPDGEVAMQLLTREMIDEAVRLGGRYYLPYRLHATVEQFDRAYPQGREFFAKKREYDPAELFRNEFYRKYGRSP